MINSTVIVIAGPTASGKSDLSFTLAKKYNSLGQKTLIINADSQQIYKELPVLSAQPSLKKQEQTPHALYGYWDASTICNAGIWAKAAAQKIQQAWQKNTLPILCGGTGFYLMALKDGIRSIPDIKLPYREKAIQTLETLGLKNFYKECLKIDSQMAEKISPQDTHRLLRLWEVFHSTNKPLSWWHSKSEILNFLPETNWESYLLLPPRDELYERINQRSKYMLQSGAIDEVKRLLELNLPVYHPLIKAVGVQEIKAYLNNKQSYAQATLKIQQYTRNFAKRQITWFNHQYKKAIVLDSSKLDGISIK